MHFFPNKRASLLLVQFFKMQDPARATREGKMAGSSLSKQWPRMPKQALLHSVFAQERRKKDKCEARGGEGLSLFSLISWTQRDFTRLLPSSSFYHHLFLLLPSQHVHLTWHPQSALANNTLNAHEKGEGVLGRRRRKEVFPPLSSTRSQFARSNARTAV